MWRYHLRFIPFFLSLYIQSVISGGCFSVPREPDSLAAPGPAEQNPPQSNWYEDCRNFAGDAPSGGWNSVKDDVNFPTVETIMADMTACGNVGRGPTMFYSFGVATKTARTSFRDTLTPRAIMFNDALPDSWTVALNKVSRFQLHEGTSQTILTQRWATALARLSKGEVFLVVKNRDGDNGGVGAYQLPNSDDNLINVWRDFEFPALQRNTAITRVTCVAINDNLRRHTDWEPNNAARYPTLPVVSLLGDPNTRTNKRSVVERRAAIGTTLSTVPATKSSVSASATSSASSDSCTSADNPANALLKTSFTSAGGKLPDSSKITGAADSSSSSTGLTKTASSMSKTSANVSSTTTSSKTSTTTKVSTKSQPITTSKAATSLKATTTKATTTSKKAIAPKKGST